MTPSEIDALNPERLLEEVAKLDGYTHLLTDRGFLVGYPNDMTVGMLCHVTPYTTSLPYAMALLMRMFDKKGSFFRVIAGDELPRDDNSPRWYGCQIGQYSEDDLAYTNCYSASDLPACICRTILKATAQKEESPK